VYFNFKPTEPHNELGLTDIAFHTFYERMIADYYRSLI